MISAIAESVGAPDLEHVARFVSEFGNSKVDKTRLTQCLCIAPASLCRCHHESEHIQCHQWHWSHL